MYHEVETKLYVDGNTGHYSQAVSLEGANAVMYEFTVFEISGATPTLTVELEESNDLQNWAPLAPAILQTASAVGYKSKSTSAVIAAQYVRLNLSMDAAGKTAVVAAGINTANL